MVPALPFAKPWASAAMLDGRVRGKVALITGAASGIGRAAALRLAEEGATVVATDLDLPGGNETVRLAKAAGGECTFIQHDVADEEAWHHVVASVAASQGVLHILVNNAGIALPAAILATSYSDWRRQLAVNLDSVFLGVKHAVPLMVRSGGGSVVNISSIAGLVGDPGLASYSASKGGVTLFSKSAALEFAKARNGVRVNSVHPGIIDTPIWTTDARSERATPAIESALMKLWRKVYLGIAGRAGVPAGHAGCAKDVADGILYLASDESRYVTGSELVIDGGFTAG